MPSAPKSAVEQVREIKRLLADADEVLSQLQRAVASLEARLSADEDKGAGRGDPPSLWARGPD